MDAATTAALLRHIGLDPHAPPPPTRDGLRVVHRAYVGTVPYEALAVQLGETAPLDPEQLARRILGGRGGYCFEVNCVLHALLTALGFDVAMHQARVDPPGPTNHVALVVTHPDGSRDIADAGLGEGSLDPLPLQPGTHGKPFAWRVDDRGAAGWWVESHEWCSFTGFEMRAEESRLTDFDPHHARLATDPESSFVKTLVVQRPADTTITSLRARTLTVVGPAGKDKRVLADADELDAVLRAVFGVTLDPGRLARAWANAARQHDDFLQSAA